MHKKRKHLAYINPPIVGPNNYNPEEKGVNHKYRNKGSCQENDNKTVLHLARFSSYQKALPKKGYIDLPPQKLAMKMTGNEIA